MFNDGTPRAMQTLEGVRVKDVALRQCSGRNPGRFREVPEGTSWVLMILVKLCTAREPGRGPAACVE